jgi:hypothetical protein
MTSTAFMAAPGGFSSTLASKLDKIDCSQVLAAVLKSDTALLGHLRMGSAGANIEVNWIEDELNPAYVCCSGSANNIITISSGYATASLQRFLRKYTVLQPEGKEYCVQITQSVTDLSVTIAAYGSTTWASWTMTKCFLVAQPWADVDSASSDSSLTRTKRKNFMQVFERAVEITQTRKNMDMEAVTDELQMQIKRRTLEIKRELNMAVIRGYARATASNTFSADHELRTMAGIIQLIRDWNLDSTNNDTMVTQASAALTAGHINSLAYKIFDAGGLDETASPIILVGPAQARVIAAMEKELRRVEQGERTVGYYRNVFLSDMGVEMPVVMDRWMPKDKLIILDRSRISIRPMSGDSWHLEKMAKTGRNEKWQLSGQYTIELRNADKCHALLYDLS